MASANATYGQKESTEQNFDYMFKILIIGNSSVGKTSFLFRYADDSFTPTFVSTVGIDFKVKTIYRNDKRIKLQIWVRKWTHTCMACANVVQCSAFCNAALTSVFSLLMSGIIKNIKVWQVEKKTQAHATHTQLNLQLQSFIFSLKNGNGKIIHLMKYDEKSIVQSLLLLSILALNFEVLDRGLFIALLIRGNFMNWNSILFFALYYTLL